MRVDAYTHVRAIAELNTGELMMSTRFVKASGGCSAPPGKDQAAAMATLGKMRFRVDGDVRARQPVLAQLMISHPNNSGLVMDQLTRHFTPAHFVRRIDVSYAGKPILTAGWISRSARIPISVSTSCRRGKASCARRSSIPMTCTSIPPCACSRARERGCRRCGPGYNP